MTPFKERMNLYRAYRELNPGKNYWDWKQSLEVPAMLDGGVAEEQQDPYRGDYIGTAKEVDEYAIDWLTNWYKNRLDYAKETKNDQLQQQINNLQKSPNINQIVSDQTSDKSLHNTNVYAMSRNAAMTGADAFYHNENDYVGIKKSLFGNRLTSNMIHELNHKLNNIDGSPLILILKIIDGAKVTDNIDKEYLTDPTEVHSRLMEIRRNASIKPNEVIDETRLNQLRKLVDDGFMEDRNILNYFEDDNVILDLFNNVAQNNQTNQNQAYAAKYGGVVPAMLGGGDITSYVNTNSKSGSLWNWTSDLYDEYVNGAPANYADNRVAIMPNGKTTDECAEYSNSILRGEGFNIWGDAWTRGPHKDNNNQKILSGYSGLSKPKSWDEQAVENYLNNAVKNFAANVDTTQFKQNDIVGIHAAGSGHLKEAYNNGYGEDVLTHTGHIVIGQDGTHYVIHNVDGRVVLNKAADLLGGTTNKRYNIVNQYRPRKRNK